MTRKCARKKNETIMKKKVNGKNVYHRFILLDDFKMMAWHAFERQREKKKCNKFSLLNFKFMAINDIFFIHFNTESGWCVDYFFHIEWWFCWWQYIWLILSPLFFPTQWLRGIIFFSFHAYSTKCKYKHEPKTK